MMISVRVSTSSFSIICHFIILLMVIVQLLASHADWTRNVPSEQQGQGVVNDCIDGSEECSKNRCNKTVDIYRTVTEPVVDESTRGKAVHCSYKVRIHPPRDDWIVFLRFTRLRVGELRSDRRSCDGGFIQIIDGFRDSQNSSISSSKRVNPGFFCGEIDMPKTYISETQHVKVVFHVDSHSEEAYFTFYVTVERRSEYEQRIGQYLHPNRRGRLTPGTYCDRVFENCSPGHCYVQSPGFPEVYPRNLRCRYLLQSKKSPIGVEVVSFDVDGQECESHLMCFPRPVTVKAEECPYDYLMVYDGPDEGSPVIATLCGWGRLASSIVASGPNMLLEFVTSPAGHFINTGFQIKADTISLESGDSKPIELKPDGSCIINRQLMEANASNLFTNPRSWIDRVTLCQESLRLFDSRDPDPDKLMNKLCDTNKPLVSQCHDQLLTNDLCSQGGASKSTYLSTGPFLLIQFSSRTGSLSGSSINYGIDVRRVIRSDAMRQQADHMNCSQTH